MEEDGEMDIFLQFVQIMKFMPFTLMIDEGSKQHKRMPWKVFINYKRIR